MIRATLINAVSLAYSESAVTDSTSVNNYARCVFLSPFSTKPPPARSPRWRPALRGSTQPARRWEPLVCNSRGLQRQRAPGTPALPSRGFPSESTLVEELATRTFLTFFFLKNNRSQAAPGAEGTRLELAPAPTAASRLRRAPHGARARGRP